LKQEINNFAIVGVFHQLWHYIYLISFDFESKQQIRGRTFSPLVGVLCRCWCFLKATFLEGVIFNP